VDNLADSKFLEFTVWGNNRYDGRKYKAVGTTNKDYFPFLDMEMYWSPEGNLQFRVHLKENQVLKYLNWLQKYTHRCMFCCHSYYRSHEKTSISYNKNREIRVNDDG
jgi:hypothetical protein